jgi:hypothetical protein
MLPGAITKRADRQLISVSLYRLIQVFDLACSWLRED